MSTRSIIAIQNGNDAVRSVYCHWDGYPEHNGKILMEHYGTAEIIAELMSYGDMSILGESIGHKHDFNAHVPGICKFYKRDRSESNVNAKVIPSSDLYSHAYGCAADYVYLFKENEWYVSNVREREELKFKRVASVLRALKRKKESA